MCVENRFIRRVSQAVRLGAPLGFRAHLSSWLPRCSVGRSVGLAPFIRGSHYVGESVPPAGGDTSPIVVMSLDDPRHQRLVDWLTTPKQERVPSTAKQLAVELGVSERTLRDWKERPQIREQWEDQARKVVGSPERAQDVLEAMYQRAIDSTDAKQVQAAKLYLEAIEAIKPPTVEVRSVSDLAKVSDDELQAMIAATAQGMLEERQNG